MNKFVLYLNEETASNPTQDAIAKQQKRAQLLKQQQAAQKAAAPEQNSLVKNTVDYYKDAAKRTVAKVGHAIDNSLKGTPEWQAKEKAKKQTEMQAAMFRAQQQKKKDAPAAQAAKPAQPAQAAKPAFSTSNIKVGAQVRTKENSPAPPAALAKNQDGVRGTKPPENIRRQGDVPNFANATGVKAPAYDPNARSNSKPAEQKPAENKPAEKKKEEGGAFEGYRRVNTAIDSGIEGVKKVLHKGKEVFDKNRGEALIAGGAAAAIGVGAIVAKIRERQKWKMDGCNSIADEVKKAKCRQSVAKSFGPQVNAAKSRCEKTSDPEACKKKLDALMG